VWCISTVFVVVGGLVCGWGGVVGGGGGLWGGGFFVGRGGVWEIHWYHIARSTLELLMIYIIT